MNYAMITFVLIDQLK